MEILQIILAPIGGLSLLAVCSFAVNAVLRRRRWRADCVRRLRAEA